jgi:hypothetical protein
MIQREFALICTMLLLQCSLSEAFPSSEASAPKSSSLKEQLTLLPSGSVIEVKLNNKQKMRGRLGALSESGFELQHTRDDKIVTEVLAFDAVKSVKPAGKGMHFATKVVIGTVLAAGVIALIGVILCAAAGCSN